jgi:hypothetical protein
VGELAGKVFEETPLAKKKPTPKGKGKKPKGKR